MCPVKNSPQRLSYLSISWQMGTVWKLSINLIAGIVYMCHICSCFFAGRLYAGTYLAHVPIDLSQHYIAGVVYMCHICSCFCGLILRWHIPGTWLGICWCIHQHIRHTQKQLCFLGWKWVKISYHFKASFIHNRGFSIAAPVVFLDKRELFSH